MSKKKIKESDLDIWVADKHKLIDEFSNVVPVIRYAGNIDQRRMADKGQFDELFQDWLEYMSIN